MRRRSRFTAPEQLLADAVSGLHVPGSVLGAPPAERSFEPSTPCRAARHPRRRAASHPPSRPDDTYRRALPGPGSASDCHRKEMSTASTPQASQHPTPQPTPIPATLHAPRSRLHPAGTPHGPSRAGQAGNVSCLVGKSRISSTGLHRKGRLKYHFSGDGRNGYSEHSLAWSCLDPRATTHAALLLRATITTIIIRSH